MSDALRLDISDLRCRIAALEGRARQQDEIILHLADMVERLALPRLERAGEVAAKHALVRALAGYFEATNAEGLARQIERACGPECAVPAGAEDIVAKLRAAYGRGGPSRATVRRALAEFAWAHESGAAAPSCSHFNTERTAP